MQAASVVGLYGLTLARRPRSAPRRRSLADRRRARRALAAPGLAASRPRGASPPSALWRLPRGADADRSPGCSLRHHAAEPAAGRQVPARRTATTIMRRYLVAQRPGRRAGRPGVADVTHLIWPESAFPFLLARDAAALAQIAALLPPGDDADHRRRARMDEPLPGETVGRFFNAIQVVVDDGAIIGSLRQGPSRARSANTCRSSSRRCSAALGLRQFVTMPGGFDAGDSRRAARRAAACRRSRRRSATRRSSRATSCRQGRARACSSTSPTMPGSASRPGPTSISPRRGCAPSRRACRWCAPPTPASRPWSTPTAACSRRCRSGVEGVLDASSPDRDLPPHAFSRLGSIPLAAATGPAVSCASASSRARQPTARRS